MALLEMIPRVVSFSLEREWIDFASWASDLLPRVASSHWIARIINLLYVTLIKLLVVELFRLAGIGWNRSDSNAEQQRLLMLMQKSK